MYRLTYKIVLFSLVLPTLVATAPVSERTGNTHFGTATWYNTGLGSCGGTSTDDQLVVALSQYIMNKEADCYKTVQISSGGITIDAQIVDTCIACGPDGLDLSPAAFQQFAPLDVGHIMVDWTEWN